ncbi:MAG: MBL fold metallo-hydrolase [Candidatus Kerfeldbacteria bacterium]|nr:MBL fold metallo-hydrolase [Candidatus Kerfeldbacteria bacterium]
MRLAFFGAAGEVTGSKHRITLAGSQVLLDCGAFQGRRRESRAKNIHLPFDPRSIEAVVISHAHFDHVGLLPVLVKNGFRGTIYATAATRDLTELILLDAAQLQVQDTIYARHHRLAEADLVEPLYTPDDIPEVMDRVTTLPYVHDNSRWQAITATVEAKLYDAGHILGSAVVVLQGREAGSRRRMVYTGDLGRPYRPLLRDPQYVAEPAETLIIESTYGGRLHRPFVEAERALVDIVAQAVRTSGHIIVPAFSLGRTQELVYELHQLTDRGAIPRLPIFVDSPLASRITDVFRRHQRDYDLESGQDFRRRGEDPLTFRNLTYVHSAAESKALNARPGPCLIISASGMASGGRVMHHLKHHLPDPTTIILFTGFQAEHTPGRRLIKGAQTIEIFGQAVPVRAQILAINDLSAHADARGLLDYAEHVAGIRRVFFVHGELDRANELLTTWQHHHPEWQITVPSLGTETTIA